MKNKITLTVLLVVFAFISSFAFITPPNNAKYNKKKCPTYKAKKVTRSGLHR